METVAGIGAVGVFFGVMSMAGILAPLLRAAWRPVAWMASVAVPFAVGCLALLGGMAYGFLSYASGGLLVGGAAGMHSENRGVAQRAQRPGRTSNFSNRVPKQQPGNGN